MKKIRKVLLLVCVLTCIFSLTACGGKKEESESLQYNESELVEALVQNNETIAEWDDETLEAAIDGYDDADEAQAALKNGLLQFKSARDEAGDYVGFYLDKNENVKYKISKKDGKVSLKAKAKFEKRDVDITYEFGLVKKELSITSITYEPCYSLSEKMKNAALNTVMGMGVVVIVLAFLSALISLFVYINKIQKAFENKKNKKDTDIIDNTAKSSGIQIPMEVEPEDDTELVAVITAAIAACEQERKNSGGFVVRSIRRVPNRKWK